MNQESSTSLKRVRKVTYKAFAYITNRNRLLVFVHPFAPEAGIQVPAGTVKAHERPDEAVLREAFEETGLSDLIVDGFLSEHERDMSDLGKDEIPHRYFYHLRCEGDPLLPGDMKSVTLPMTQNQSCLRSSGHHCQKVSHH
jgi:8-oxo-dGTP pyrophosphatase MutT (NUDIX family)